MGPVSAPRAALDASDVARLEALETSLWQEASRYDATHLDAVLAPDFVEFGASGRVHDRRAILVSEALVIGARIPLEDFAVYPLDTQMVRVSYVSDDGLGADGHRRRVRRTSLWTRGGAFGWQLRLSQGTPMPVQS